MKRYVMLLFCAGLAACEKPNEPDAIPLPMPETVAPAVDTAVDAVLETDTAKANEPVLDLDIRLPPPADEDIEKLDEIPKADLGNVFEKPGKNRPINVKGEVFLTEEVTGNGKAKTTVDGAQVTVEKPIR